MQGDHTGYKKIKSLEPSSLITIDKKNNILFKKYYEAEKIKTSDKKKYFEKKDQDYFKEILSQKKGLKNES